MSEIKRATLIPFSSQKVEDKKCKEVGKTVRIAIVLPESNEDTCPEYSYKEELAAAKRKDKIKHIKSTTNGLDPFNDDDDDVRRIAQEMEAKYGIVGTKKKRKGRRDDYADIGMGYDESDSFIDNTDGYDEMIPQNVTTLHGGFYINCGALEFKTDDEVSSEISSSSSDEEDTPEKSASRKRILETSSESEGEKETEKDLEHIEKKPKLYTNGIPKLIKSKFITPDKVKQLKRKRNEEKEKRKAPTVKELLKEKREDDNIISTDSQSLEVADSKEDPTDSMKENKKPMSLANISDIIESVVRGVDEEMKTSDRIPHKSNEKAVVSPSTDGENSKDSDEQKKQEVEIVKLPENLPNDIVEIIIKIKEYASKSTQGKVKFFSGPVSEILLSLERKCKCLGKQSRMKIFEHLAPFIKCRKETLIRRAKNLVLEDDHLKLKTLLHKLKGEIENVMPSLLENYERESQRIMQKKFSKESLSNEENKQLRMPKRRFTWTEDIKKLLKEILLLRKRCFVLEGKNKDLLEMLLNNYLKSDIQVLWPDGWMSITALQKVCNNITSSEPRKSTTASAKSLSVNNHSSVMETSTKKLENLPSNSNLSIIPVSTNIQKPVNSSVNSVKPRTLNKSDITINKVDSNDISNHMPNKPLPDVIKTSNALTITPAVITTAKITSERMDKIDFIKPNIESELILIEDSKPKSKAVQENNTTPFKPEINKVPLECLQIVPDMKKLSEENSYLIHESTKVRNENSDVKVDGKHDLSTKNEALQLKHEVNKVRIEGATFKQDTNKLRNEQITVQYDSNKIRSEDVHSKHISNKARNENIPIKHDTKMWNEHKHDANKPRNENQLMKPESNKPRSDHHQGKHDVNKILLKHDTIELRTDNSQTKHDINKIRSEHKHDSHKARIESSHVKHDVNKLWTENVQPKHDGNKMRTEHPQTKPDINKGRTESVQLKHDTNKVRSDNTHVKHDVNKVRSENSQVKHDHKVRNEAVSVKHDVNKFRNDNVQVKHDHIVRSETVHLKHDINKVRNDSQHKHDTKPRSDNNHCQIIDLTDQSPDMKKKPPTKVKSKYFEGDMTLKVKSTSELMKPKQVDKEEITGSAVLNHLITESLSDQNPQNLSKTPVSSHSKHSEVNPKNYSKPVSSFSTSTPTKDFSKIKSTNEGDDIQKVMEDLKVLQKLSSPVKICESPISSPVSVIAFNKNYSPKAATQNTPVPQTPTTNPYRNEYTKADFSSGFQEAFQRQLLANDFALLQNPTNHSTPTSSKSHYNSTDKYPHSSAAFLNDKYYQTSNNNYTQQNSSKIKNHPPQQTGSYNILDDMLANFLTEYGYPKPANHIPNHLPKPPQK